jgi:flagellar biosynthesis anti-sigma factor FlgM
MATPITPPSSSPPAHSNNLAASSKGSPPSSGSEKSSASVAKVDGNSETVHLSGLVPNGGPPMNHAKIEAISKAIAEGRYSIDPNKLAGNLFNAETALFG